MSRMTTVAEEQERISFAKRAAEHFAKHPEHYTFTGGDIVPGCLFAVRWGIGDDCVLVFRVDPDCEVVNFQQAVQRGLDGG